MDRRYAASVCVLLLAVAGCSALSGAAPSQDVTATLTPVPVTETSPSGETATPQPRPASAFPPGVSPDGTVDPDRLFEAHVESLAERSYTWVYRKNERANGSGTFSGQTRVRVDDGVGSVENRGFRSGMNNSLYLTDQNGYLRWTNGNQTRYTVRNVTVADRRYSFVEYGLRTFLPEQGVQTSVVEWNGRRYVRLYVQPRPPPPGLTEQLVDSNLVWGFTLTAYVSPAGRVQMMAVEYNDRQAHVSWRFDYRAVGETNVTRPDWVSRAKDNRSTRTTPSTRNRTTTD
jgi:hypothetical protein